MSNTTNLGLKKYASSEKFAITAVTNSFNNNMDLIDTAIGNEAPLYDATDAYYVGDYCLYNGVTYRCKTDIETPEAFDNTHWEAVTIGEEMTDTNFKKSQLDEGLAYVAEKVGSYWRLPSGKTAAAGDYIILDGSLGKATSQIVGGSTNITSSNWSIETNGALNELGDAIDTLNSKIAKQTGSVKFGTNIEAASASETVVLTKSANTVCCSIAIKATETVSAQTVVFTLSDGYKPAGYTFFAVMVGNTPSYGYVESNGSVRLGAAINSGAKVYGSVSFGV